MVLSILERVFVVGMEDVVRCWWWCCFACVLGRVWVVGDSGVLSQVASQNSLPPIRLEAFARRVSRTSPARQ